MQDYHCSRLTLLTTLLAGFIAFFCLTLCPSSLLADKVTSSVELASARKGMVVTVSGPASDAGAEVLRQGGNAVDAAVASALALAVTWPVAGNIGGGGYMLVYPSNGGQPIAFDFRETAPLASTREMFVRPEDRSPHRRVGVPGTVAGLVLAHKKYGKFPWKDLVAPAIRLAGEGFKLDNDCAQSLNGALRAKLKNEEADAVTRLGRVPPSKNSPHSKAEIKEEAEFRRVFGKPGGGEWQAGDLLVQPDLKVTLERIAKNSADGFYSGPVADLIVEEMKRGGGIITKEDLARYHALERVPLHGTYRGYEIFSMPPSSSGGVTLLEELNILEQFDLRKEGRWSPLALHLMIESARRAYRDRACYLGDPAFVKIPDFLTDKKYAKKLAAGINLAKATPSKDLAGDIKLAGDGNHTTHLSVVDKDGAAVSLTYTLENGFGGLVVVKGAGFVLNDEMNDFAWLPDVTDSSGRIGTPPNYIVPGKRMLSSMCPTIVAKDGKPLLVTGSRGGRTIINSVLSIIVNVVDFEMTPREAVDAPRFHHQWLPDSVALEPAIMDTKHDLVEGLKRLGHRIERGGALGDSNTVWINPRTGEMVGIADHRANGKASTP